MDVASFYIIEKRGIKVAKWGTSKNILKTNLASTS